MPPCLSFHVLLYDHCMRRKRECTCTLDARTPKRAKMAGLARFFLSALPAPRGEMNRHAVTRRNTFIALTPGGATDCDRKWNCEQDSCDHYTTVVRN